MSPSAVNPVPSDGTDYLTQESAIVPLARSIPGSMPGLLRAPAGAKPSRMTVWGIGVDALEERTDVRVADIPAIIKKHDFHWVNVNGLADVELVAEIGRRYELHPLALEDVLNTHQRPKSDDYGDNLFVVLRMPVVEGRRMRTQQFALFLGTDYVVSFHEFPGDCLEPVRERIRQNSGRIRKSGANYLAYALMDAIIDSYFPGMDGYAQLLDDLDERVGQHTARKLLSRIHVLRRDLQEIRKTIWKSRDAVNFLVRDETPLIDDETRFYLRDCYDHTIQLIDLVETFREMCTDLRDYYMATVSQRANEVMKFLTVTAAIFIPLNFLAALYGMNFEWMPELKWPWSYPALLTAMLSLAGGMSYVFWRRGWFRGDD